jgi:hypothetical protein
MNLVSRTRSSWVVAFGELLGTMEAARGIYEARWEHQAMSNQPRQSTQIQDRRRCLGRVREWSNTISYMKRCDRLSREGQRFEIKSRTEEDALEEWGNGAIQSATWRGATDCHVKDRDSRLNSKMKWNKKQAWHGGEREKQSNRLTWLLYMS